MCCSHACILLLWKVLGTVEREVCSQDLPQWTFAPSTGWVLRWSAGIQEEVEIPWPSQRASSAFWCASLQARANLPYCAAGSYWNSACWGGRTSSRWAGRGENPKQQGTSVTPTLVEALNMWCFLELPSFCKWTPLWLALTPLWAPCCSKLDAALRSEMRCVML